MAEVDTRILVRTTRIAADELALARRLQQASAAPVALVADARSGAVDGTDPDVIALSSAACQALQLFCPPDFAWRCGDYGYYLARRRYPTTERFWLIETDVAIYGGETEAFFAFFAERAREVDLLAAAAAAGRSFLVLDSIRAGPRREGVPVPVSDHALIGARHRRGARTPRVTGSLAAAA